MVATGRWVDVAVAALTVTADRRKVMDFTQPFFESGLGVAVPYSDISAWLPATRTSLSIRFLQAVLTLLPIIVGRHPDLDLRAGATTSITAVAQCAASSPAHGGRPSRRPAGAAQQGPRSTPGRVLAVIWMVASVVTIAVFIAGITSALTTQRLQGIVRTTNDLRRWRAGAVAGSSTVDFLAEREWRSAPIHQPRKDYALLSPGRSMPSSMIGHCLLGCCRKISPVLSNPDNLRQPGLCDRLTA